MIVCQDEAYLRELVRYIHLSLLMAGIGKDMKVLRRYKRCGHSAVMGVIHRLWQDRDTILVHFGKRGKRAIEKYERFVSIDMNYTNDYT